MIFKVSYSTEQTENQFRDTLQILMPHIIKFIENTTGHACTFVKLSKAEVAQEFEARFRIKHLGLIEGWSTVEQWFQSQHGHNYRCTNVTIEPEYET